MKPADKSRTYLKRFVAWVDRDIDRTRTQYSPSFGIIFLPVILALIAEFLGVSGKWLWPIALASMTTWFLFWSWRFVLSLSRMKRQPDSLYDRKIKHLLPPGYADTHSATKAAELRARRKMR